MYDFSADSADCARAVEAGLSDYLTGIRLSGPGPAALVYGMLKATPVSPGASVDIEYRIGHTYAHLAMME